MSRFLRDNGSIITLLGAGIIIGSSATVIYYKLTRNIPREIAELAVKLERLCQDVNELKRMLEDASQSKKRRSGYYSVHQSSGEDDDEFEEAFDDTFDER